jgi:hypothetical protein
MEKQHQEFQGIYTQVLFVSADIMITRNLKKANHAERVGRKATGLNP